MNKTKFLFCVGFTFAILILWKSDVFSSARFKITDINFLGSVWGKGHAAASVISQDGGQSFMVPGGSLWAFGDTFRGSRDSEGIPHFHDGGVSCAIAFLPDISDSNPLTLHYRRNDTGLVETPFAFLSGESWDSHRIWPGDGAYVNGKYYLFYELIGVGEGGGWNFWTEGAGLAKSDSPLGRYERLMQSGNWRYPFDPTDIIEQDTWLYLFGIDHRRNQSGVVLARVPKIMIEDPFSYEYQDKPGSSFSIDPADSFLLVKNIAGQVSIAWNEYLGSYVMASSSDLYSPREIRFHVATRLTGPWIGPVAKIKIPPVRQGKEATLVYCAYLHPQLFRDGGRIMVLTHSMHLKDSWDANNEMIEFTIQR